MAYAVDPQEWTDAQVERVLALWGEGENLKNKARAMMSEAASMGIAHAAVEAAADAWLGRELVARLSAVAGDGGQSEGAVECLERILRERDQTKAGK